MELILLEEIIASVPARWARQYENYIDTGSVWDKGPVTKALQALKPGFTAEEVNEIIGNKSWTRLDCSICKKPQEVALHLYDGDLDDYDTASLYVCLPCLRKGVRLFKEQSK